MAALATGDLELPDNIMTPWLGKVRGGSVLATLSPAEAQRFGKGTAMVFDSGEAELVSEGGQKSSNDITKTVQSVEPHKFQKTVRMNEEVLWADEDGQTDAVEQILAQIQPALSRALDFGAIHGINPKTGAVSGTITQKFASVTNQVERAAADKPYANLDAADLLVLTEGYVPSDIALDPKFAAAFSSLRAGQTEQKLYPNFRLSTEVSELDGHRSSVSRTVSGAGVVASPSGILGIVGDFGGFRWGIQKQIGLELIRYGDPDGQGDLKRNNQVAFRAEVVYGWGISDLDAFALIVDKVA
ncbi:MULTISPECIES: phage major capsid protein [unclassified Microbacterium]|uniref:phage major capsid family protein n=1 Tax=unclassified Microbacterium TaxID=2609290 RepID=UPI002469A0BC|nr:MULTISPECIES: phage major capsid protein [unclassified Microbacterium]MDH5134065.1 phage major capsid protein [Microbacterium sp. RD10]MDH5136831.1 phage major capsid protein [Microbacterium sp. RD11]MDH5146388.1 phage major capsid protein [Microbacterium sp. RD12]MDH5155122.1 phage major capsid protein [Microbacterium sp. RD06]MDH5166596.1 phage major capsid protein [Microbacterium sp. RD02]